MNNKSILKYIQDNLGYIFIYFGSHIIVYIYDYYFNQSIGSMYIVSPFVIYIAIKYMHHYKSQTEIRRLIDNVKIDDYKVISEQKEIVELIYKIHKNCENTIYENTLKAQKTQKFTFQWIHNMKSPLSVIDLIIQKHKNEEVDIEVAIEHINQEKEKILRNLDQVLKVSRLENFAADYIPEKVDLVNAVREMINCNKNQYLYGNVFPVLECTRDQVPVLTDKKWNEAMIEQIVTNAIKYSDVTLKPKNIYFSIEVMEEHTLLMIRDEGIGIPPIDIKRVFEPFFTGQNGRTNRKATGIGLYFCKEVSKKLNHKIKIFSEEGVGTTVKIYYLSKLKGNNHINECFEKMK